LDWQGSLVSRWNCDPKLTAVAEIVRLAATGDPSLASTEQRVARFCQNGQGSRRSYLRYQKTAMERLGLPKLPRAESSRAVQIANGHRVADGGEHDGHGNGDGHGNDLDAVTVEKTAHQTNLGTLAPERLGIPVELSQVR
jgi:hypothetical protein